MYADVIKSSKGPDGFVQTLKLRGLYGAICSAEEPADIYVVKMRYAGRHAKPALEKAADLLSERMYSVQGLKDKMASLGYNAAEAGEAVATLVERGYLSDGEFAASFVRRAAAAGKGKRRIQQELKQKGVSAEASAAALLAFAEENPDEGEYERALQIASNMPHSNEKEIARIGGKLARQGYEPSIIYKVIDSLRG